MNPSAPLQLENLAYALDAKAAEVEERAWAWNSNHGDGLFAPTQQDRHLLQQRRGITHGERMISVICTTLACRSFTLKSIEVVAAAASFGGSMPSSQHPHVIRWICMCITTT